MKAKCMKCNCKSYNVLYTRVYCNDFYIREYQCRKCGNAWIKKYELNTNINKYIYILVNKKNTSLHRFIYENYFNVQLRQNEFIHHKNFNKGDNRPSNLMLMKNYEHYPNQHYKDLLDENKKLKNKIRSLQYEIKRIKTT